MPRDGRGRPLIVPRSGGKPTVHSRVTSHKELIEDKTGVHKWELRHLLAGVARRPSLLDGLAALDPDDKANAASFDKMVAAAFRVSDKDFKARRGTRYHEFTEANDRGLPLPPDMTDVEFGDLCAYIFATADFEMLLIEQFVVVEELMLAGTLDRAMRVNLTAPDGEFVECCIGDVKTGSLEYGGQGMEAQEASYEQGWIYDPSRFPAPDRKLDGEKAWNDWKATEFSAAEAATAYSPLPPVSKKWGMIIHMPPGQARVDLYWADLECGRKSALLASEVKDRRKSHREHGGLIRVS